MLDHRHVLVDYAVKRPHWGQLEVHIFVTVLCRKEGCDHHKRVMQIVLFCFYD